MKMELGQMAGEMVIIYSERTVTVDGITGRIPDWCDADTQVVRTMIELRHDRADAFGDAAWYYHPGRPIDEDAWLRWGRITWAPEG